MHSSVLGILNLNLIKIQRRKEHDCNFTVLQLHASWSTRKDFASYTAVIAFCHDHRYDLCIDECREETVYWTVSVPFMLMRCEAFPLIVLAYFIYFGVPSGMKMMGGDRFQAHCTSGRYDRSCDGFAVPIWRKSSVQVFRVWTKDGKIYLLLRCLNQLEQTEGEIIVDGTISQTSTPEHQQSVWEHRGWYSAF